MRAGQPLVRLDVPDLEERALAARSDASRTAAEREEARAALDGARSEAADRQRTYQASKRLAAEGAIARGALEADRLAAERAQEKLRTAQARFDELERTRLGLARRSAEELERRSRALTVKAPADGIVYGLPRKEGEPVTAGQVVAGVYDPARLVVRTRVDAPDLPRVKPGQRLVVAFDGLPDRRWDGTVSEVSRGLRDAAGREVGEVLGAIATPDPALPPNAPVNVEIVAGERKGVIAVPRAALVRDGEARAVFVLDGDRARKKPVTAGLVGLEEVEITGGLGEGDVVLLPSGAPLVDGERVKPVT